MPNDLIRTTRRLRPIFYTAALLAMGVGLWFMLEPTDAHGTCKTHHQYRTYDGTHDGDGDGVGCESLPAPPSRSGSVTTTTSGGGYDRDNWSYRSSSARSALGCNASEHVDHIVALKEAYDSGAHRWTNNRKATFANDCANMWCLEAGLSISKSDHDLAEWRGGSCEQRKHIATVTVAIKTRYALSTDAAEQSAINLALAAQCGGAHTSSSAAHDKAGHNTKPAHATDVPEQEALSDELSVALPIGRIVARRLADGRTEFGYQPEIGDRSLPKARFFPTTASIDRWLQSSPVIVDGQDIGRISARLLIDGRIEFSFLLNDGERVLPKARYFPATSSGAWLRSSSINLKD